MQDLVKHGGAIVSSADCHEIEIAEAQACGRFGVDADGMGFVRRTKEWLLLVMPEDAEDQALDALIVAAMRGVDPDGLNRSGKD